MANDLIAKLKLDGSNFDTNINKSKRYVKDFDSQVSGMAMSGVKSFAGFAGGIVAAGGALATFEKFIGSTQTTADFFGNNMAAVNGTVDAFFVSLNSGDWNAFSDGVIGAYKNMKAFADLMDELEDKRLSLTFVSADNMKDLAKYEEIIKDPNSTRDQKIDAAQNYQGIVNYQSKKTKDVINTEIEALKKDYSSRSKMNIDLGDMRYFAANTNADSNLTNDSIDIYKEHIRLQKESENLRKAAEYDAINNGYNPNSGIQKQYSDLQKISSEYKKQNEFMIKQGFMANEGDIARENLYKTLSSISKQEEDIYVLQVKSNKLEKQAHKGTESSSKPDKPNKPEEAKEGSIASDKKILNDLRTKFENTTDEGIRDTLRNQIYYLELEVKFKETGKRDGLVDMLDIEDISDEELDLKFDDWNLGDDTKQTSDLDYITSMTELMSNLSSATNGATSNWFQYTSGILTGIGQMLPQLWALLGINTNLAIVQSAMKTPFPLNLIALASTASAVMGAMVNIPKFADGGIIGGSNFLGDNMIARVNSGEMILNSTQQGKLFNILNSGSGNVSGSGSNKIDLRVSGKDLVAVLNNYNSKMSRI